MGRLNRPALMVYGGTIKPGHRGEQKLDIISAFQSYGEFIVGSIDEDTRQDIISKSCPGDQVPAVACIPLILWHRQLRP